MARWLQAAPPGSTVSLSGFLAARSANSKALRLHIHTIEFAEGNKNGQVLQEEG
jgi:primosomal replication protein N